MENLTPETKTAGAVEMSASDKMYQDACTTLGIAPLTIDDFSKLGDEAQAFYSLHRITTVIKARKALAGDVKFDWNNRSEWKHFPWWDMETYGDAPAGSGFSLHGVNYTSTGTSVGARLSSRTENDARGIAETMIDDYRNWERE